MVKERILWADDEIDLLKPHIIFLEAKGYELTTVTNGVDAVEEVNSTDFDLIFLDENMPGLSGLETLDRIKNIRPLTPVVMITKSEAEDLMQQAIGARIADYLIKPVNPNQILLTILKNLRRKELVTEMTHSGYQQDFGRIGMQINDSLTADDWIEVYKRIVRWELELDATQGEMNELLLMQKNEANSAFFKFVRRNYETWMQHPDKRPTMTTDIFKKTIFPILDNGKKLCLVVIDNLRFDQWRTLAGELTDLFSIEEDLYYSILPTATQYARNSLFSGLMPDKIATMFPDLWVDEDSEEGKNLNEAPLIQTHFDRYRRKHSFSYHKINESAYAERLLSKLSTLRGNDLNVFVINFVDMLSHARTDSRMVRELTSSDAAYRSLTLSWFRHSPIKDLFRSIAEAGYQVVLTTDHGAICVNNPIKVIGDRNTSTNLRYKLGRSLTYNPKQVLEMQNPERYHLPCPNVSSTYIIAGGRDFFAYPNNYNHYVSYYANTFQHGGISMEEMIIPLITLTPR